MSTESTNNNSVTISLAGCSINLPNLASCDCNGAEIPFHTDINNVMAQFKEMMTKLKEERTMLHEDQKKWKEEIASKHNEICNMLVAEKQAAELAKEIDDLKQQNGEVRYEILQQRLMKLEEELNLSNEKLLDLIERMNKRMKDLEDEKESYQEKYAKLEQLMDLQRKRMDDINSENCDIRKQLEEVQIKFDTKILEVVPITDMMRATQMKLHDTKYMQNLAERNAKELTKQINSIWEQVTALLQNREITPEEIAAETEAGKGEALPRNNITMFSEGNNALKTFLKKQKDISAGMVETAESCDSEGDSVKEEMEEIERSLQNDNDEYIEYMNRECNLIGSWGYQGSIARYLNLPMPLRRMEAENPAQTIVTGIISFDQARRLNYGMASPANISIDNEYTQQAGSSKPAIN